MAITRLEKQLKKHKEIVTNHHAVQPEIRDIPPVESDEE